MDVTRSPSTGDVVDVKPVLWPAELEVMLRIGHWTTPDQLLSEALEALLAAHPDLREQVAVELFQHQVVSLARAAELAGMDQWSFREVLKRCNVALVVEVPDPATMDETIREFTGRNA
jgi:predicted HTH domain antitoxin